MPIIKNQYGKYYSSKSSGKPKKYNNKEKYCPGCKKWLLLKCFYKNNSAPSGASTWCSRCTVDYSNKYNEKNRQKISDRRFRIRSIVFSHYGNGVVKCVCCGESEIKFLSIDHINGSGNKERKKTKRYGMSFYYYLIKNNFPGGLQTLCHNCNLAKGNYGECPHKKK